MFLVTGATGFVGSAVVALLHERGHAVRAVVRDPARADVLPADVERVPADLADGEALVRAMDGCEGVFHLAAAVGAPGPEAHELNVGGTRRVVDAVRRAGVRRLVHTSTSAAICVPDPDGPGCLVAEDAAGGTALTDPYSTTKAEAEAVVLDAVAADIKLAQEEGSVRAGDPRQLGAMCLLITQSTIQSGQIVAPILDADALAVELAHSLNGYLTP